MGKGAEFEPELLTQAGQGGRPAPFAWRFFRRILLTSRGICM
jgi:hypothetical protein